MKIFNKIKSLCSLNQDMCSPSLLQLSEMEILQADAAKNARFLPPPGSEVEGYPPGRSGCQHFSSCRQPPVAETKFQVRETKGEGSFHPFIHINVCNFGLL